MTLGELLHNLILSRPTRDLSLLDLPIYVGPVRDPVTNVYVHSGHVPGDEVHLATDSEPFIVIET